MARKPATSAKVSSLTGDDLLEVLKSSSTDHYEELATCLRAAARSERFLYHYAVSRLSSSGASEEALRNMWQAALAEVSVKPGWNDPAKLIGDLKVLQEVVRRHVSHAADKPTFRRATKKTYQFMGDSRLVSTPSAPLLFMGKKEILTAMFDRIVNWCETGGMVGRKTFLFHSGDDRLPLETVNHFTLNEWHVMSKNRKLAYLILNRLEKKYGSVDVVLAANMSATPESSSCLDSPVTRAGKMLDSLLRWGKNRGIGLVAGIESYLGMTTGQRSKLEESTTMYRVYLSDGELVLEDKNGVRFNSPKT